MRNRGVGNPVRNTILCGLIAVSGFVALYVGGREMDPVTLEAGRMSWAIVYGLLATVLGTAFFFNFLRAVRIFQGMKEGKKAIARWTLSPAEYERFRAIDRQFRHRGLDNDYKLLRTVSPQGVEIIFADDGVLIGDKYFGLATTGIARIEAVEYFASDPPVLAFSTALTSAYRVSHIRIQTHRGQLRVPVAPDHELRGRKLKDHFQSILEGRTVVNPNFWTRRVKGALIAATFSALAAATGFAFADRNQELNNIPLILAVSGTIIALAGLLLAMIAAQLRKRQYGG